MSLLTQYTASQNLQGFTLGFNQFFTSFVLTQKPVSHTWRFTWNDVLLSSGHYTVNKVGYSVEPCRCSNPMGGWGYGILKCPLCGHQGVLEEIKCTYFTCTPGTPGYLENITEFIQTQTEWIASEPTQALYKHQKRKLKEECQRRVNFFVQALHTEFSGKSTPEMTGRTFDPFLRDIRNLAHLCLKD